MKKISLLVLICMILSLVFASCDMILPQTSDEDPHEHSYSTDWSFDAANHYHACSCGSQSDVAAHADGNNDGACDTCAIILSNVHTFAGEWTTDAANHWHASLCGHDVVDAKAAHTANDLGFCTVCGVKVSAPAIETVADAIEIADLAASFVKTGFVDSVYAYEGDYGTEYDYEYTWYSFAENYLHIYETGSRVNTYITLKDDEVFALSVYNSGYVYLDEEATEDYLNGPEFKASFFDDYSTAYYGAVDLINGLYELGLQDLNGDFVENVNGNACAFSYLYYSDGYLYSVEVIFTVDPELYYVDSVDICINRYEETSSFFSYDIWDYVNVTNYTAVTVDDNTVYTLSDDAVTFTSQTYAISQSVETVPENTPDEVKLISCSFVDGEGNAIDFENGVSMKIGSYSIYFADVLPVTAILDIADIEVVFTDAEGNEVYSCYGYYSEGSITLSAYKVGTYIANITINGNVYALTLNVSYATPETISAAEYKESQYSFVEIDSKTINTGKSFLLAGYVAYGCDPGFVAELVGDNAANATLTATTTDDGDVVYEFTSDVAGTYKVKITSTANSEATCELEITVEEKTVSVDSLIKGTYEYVVDASMNMVITVVFDTENNTATASVVHPMRGELTDTFNYTIVDNVFTATLAQGGSNFFQSLFINDDMQLVIVADMTEYILTPAAIEVTGASDWSGDVPTLDSASATYVTTVPAYEYSYFKLLYSDEVSYNVTITFDNYEGDIYCYYGNPMRGGNMLQSGGYLTLDTMSSDVLFWFESMNETEDHAVTFTLTFTEI